MDRQNLRNASELADIVRRHPRVRLVATGHPSTPGYNDPAYPIEGRVGRAV